MSSSTTPSIDRRLARDRFVFASTSLLSLLVGGLAYANGNGNIRAGAFLYFALIGIGSSLCGLARSMRLATRMSITFLVSMSVLTFVSLTMSGASLWHPVPLALAVAVVAATLHIVGLYRSWGDLFADPQVTDASQKLTRENLIRHLRVISPSWAALTVGTGLWLSSALTHQHIDPGFGGFLTEIGPLWYAGVLLILTGLFFARGKPERVAATAVVLLMLALTLTPSIVYDGARATTGAKHVGLIQEIRTGRPLDTHYPIYNSWNGFFAAMAWLFDIMGIKDPSHFTAYWPPIIGLFRISALRYLASRFLQNSYHAWIAVALCTLADSIGTDYFSPQSVGFTVGITLFGLALSSVPIRWTATGLLLGGSLLAVSHQLSPYVTAGTLIVMVLFRQLRPWWSPLLVLLPANLWALLHHGALKGFVNLREIGHAQNFAPPKTSGLANLHRLPIVGDASWCLVGGIGLIACLAAVSILRFHDRQAWSMGFCSIAGFGFVAVSPYGNEGIFRALLFSIPWLVFLAMRWAVTCRWERFVMLGVRALLLPVLLVTFLVSSFGLDAINVVKPGDLFAFQTFEATQVGPTQQPAWLAQLGPGNLPGILAAKSARQTEISRSMIEGGGETDSQQVVDQNPETEVAHFTKTFLSYTGQSPQDANLYAVWSPLSSDFAQAYALEKPQTFAGLRDAFLASPYWKIVTDQDGTILFRFDGANYPQSSSGGG